MQSILDDQFTQLLKLQDESNPDFVNEVVGLFFQDSDRLISNMGTALWVSNFSYLTFSTNIIPSLGWAS